MNQVRIIGITSVNTILALNLFWHNDCVLIRKGTNALCLGSALTDDLALNSFVHLVARIEKASYVADIEVAFGVKELMREIAL